MSATWAFRQLTPESETHLISKPALAPQWEPIDDLEVRDRFSGKIRCLGITIRDTRCRWDTDNYALRSRVPQLEDVLMQLSQKSPHHVTDHDLWNILNWGICDRHGSCEGSAKTKGLGDLQTRLAAARSRVGMHQATHVEHQSQDLSNTLYHKSIELEQYRSANLALQAQLADSQKNAASQLQSQSRSLQEQEAKCFALGDELHRLTIKTEDLEKTVKELHSSSTSQDLINNQRIADLNHAHGQIANLQALVNEKELKLAEANEALDMREAELEQLQSATKADIQRMHDALSKMSDEHQIILDAQQREHQAQVSQYQGVEQECLTLRAETEYRRNESAMQTSQITGLSQALESERRARTTPYNDHQINDYDEVKATNDILLHELQNLTASRNAAVAEGEHLKQQLQTLASTPMMKKASSTVKRKSLRRFFCFG